MENLQFLLLTHYDLFEIFHTKNTKKTKDTKKEKRNYCLKSKRKLHDKITNKNRFFPLLCDLCSFVSLCDILRYQSTVTY
jgi:hypothetical protein